MQTLVFRILDSSIPPEMRADPECFRRARTVLGITLILTLLGIESSLFFHIAASNAALRFDVALAVGLALVLAIPVSFRRTGSTEQGSNLLLSSALLVMATTFSLAGGITAPTLHWLAFLPMIAVLMGSRRSAIRWSGAAFGTLLLFILADFAGLSFVDRIEFSQASRSSLWFQHHREAATVADRVLHSLSAPFELGELEIFISASIGIAICSAESEDPEELLRNADLAMYHAKEKGRANYKFFDESMNADIIRRSNVANDIRRALLSDEFELHFQPIVEPHTYRILGAEALIRWNHPEKGLVFPDAFIDIAEESGLITRIGDWTIWRCCQQLQKWRSSGVALPRISINVSVAQFRNGGIIGTISEALRSCFIPPECIVLEVTEHAMLSDEEEASNCLAELKKLGVGISLDDFGTGYSSLSYAKRFPVDSLKIDRSFVSGMEDDPDARGISTAIIAMAHQLGLRVTAEGVETLFQEAFLTEHGCDELQGYLYCRPIPPDELLPLIEAGVLPPPT